MSDTVLRAGQFSLRALAVSTTDNWTIEPAKPTREWMDTAPARGAYRCLPLAIANQFGWVVTCPTTVCVRWSGRSDAGALSLRFIEDPGPNAGQIISHFGAGILTFSLPWLFRTDPGVVLMVRGPTNYFKESCAPLDGVVETDWSCSTFTMNWKITRRNTDVWFKRGEPICMLQPYPVELLERMAPTMAPIGSDPEIERGYEAWRASRTGALVQRARSGDDVWQKDYMQGRTVEGAPAAQHRTKLKLAPFRV
ncbi:MAG: DUF6065 family protein [Phycisphaerales bacterium JB039]